MKVNQIPTPALIIDIDTAEKNHKRMLEILSPRGIALRPHYKSHKSTVIAHVQVNGGAKGITCAKLEEAEDLVFSGIKDILIGNQVIDKAKVMRLAELAGYCHMAVCVDTEENIADLETAAAFFGSTIHCLVEYDLGMKRCGVYTHEDVIRLVLKIIDAPHLEFMGIQAYAGQLAHEEDYASRLAESNKVDAALKALVASLNEAGIKVPEVSGISTGTAALRTEDTVYTEAQAGSYILMDAAYGKVGAGFDHAFFLLSQVVSEDSKHFTTDAGAKTVGTDQGMPVVVGYEGADILMSEEHCAVYPGGMGLCFGDQADEVTVSEPVHTLKVGDKVRLIPGHVCTTINLYDHIYLIRGDEVVDRIKVTGRGKSR